MNTYRFSISPVFLRVKKKEKVIYKKSDKPLNEVYQDLLLEYPGWAIHNAWKVLDKSS